MSGLNRISVGRIINGFKNAFYNTSPKTDSANHKGRSVQKAQGQPVITHSQSSPSLSSPRRASLQTFQSITTLPSQSTKPHIPRPKDPAQDALKKMEEDHKLIDDLSRLPPVPTEKPRIKPGPPTNLPDMNSAISSAETVNGLIKLWNHLSSDGARSSMTLNQRLQLRQRFPGRLNMVSKKPGQARLINEKILKTMIPDLKKRNDISHQILKRNFAEVFPDSPKSKGWQ